MRHRIGIGGMTGLGNPDPVLLNNKGKLTNQHKKMMKEAFELWKPLQYGADFQFYDDGFSFGREPAYQYEELCIIRIRKERERSYIITGKAFDSYGTGIRSRTKLYSDFKRKNKFCDFVDKWYNLIQTDTGGE